MTGRKINWMVIGIAVLVLLNIGLVATLLLRQKAPADHQASEPPQGGPGAMIVRELSFDSVQARRFDTLRNAHHAAVQQLREQMRTLKDRYFDGIRRNEPAPDSIGAAMAALQVQVDRTTYNHFRDVRALCKPEQQEKFDRMFQRILAQIGNARPRRDGPGPGHDGPPNDGAPHDGPRRDGPHDGPQDGSQHGPEDGEGPPPPPQQKP